MAAPPGPGGAANVAAMQTDRHCGPMTAAVGAPTTRPRPLVSYSALVAQVEGLRAENRRLSEALAGTNAANDLLLSEIEER